MGIGRRADDNDINVLALDDLVHVTHLRTGLGGKFVGGIFKRIIDRDEFGTRVGCNVLSVDLADVLSKRGFSALERTF